ncbi:MAG: M6 family metalloprotease domain-containing protein [Calditrichaeota bacterium]|nr:M6 family metalloprotease domain-containing protein [Calditrichota bacterium]
MSRLSSHFLALLAFLSAALAYAMPPHPELARRLQQENRPLSTVGITSEVRARGVNAPFPFHIEQHRRDGSDETILRAICILADFADNEADTGASPVEHYQTMLFSEGEFDGGSMRDWYLENSYGEVHIVGEVFGWYRMPQDYAYYVGGRNGFGAYPRNAQRLAEDAIRAADADVNFRDYDNDRNGVVEAIFIVHAGPGAESTGSDDDIWSHAWQVPGNVRPDGVRFASYAMEPENGQIGVFGHELGHSMFGLPDLYDGTYESSGVGAWSMMAGGSWGGGGRRPVHFDAWCKSQVGFLDYFPIVDNQIGLTLEPVEIEGDVRFIWRRGEFGRQYFLIENRRRIGFDRSLPGEGLVIYHIDETMENNNHAWWPGSGNQLHYKVAVEQADGNYDLEHGANGGDAGDPWPGNTFNEMFGGDTEPSTRDYFGRETDVSLRNIEPVGDGRVRFDAYITPGPGPEDLHLFLLERIPGEHTFPHPDDRGDTIMTTEVELVTGMLGALNAAPEGRGRELPNDLFRYNVVLYLESWREGDDDIDQGLTAPEQRLLISYLEAGGRLVLVGPDVATNLAGDSLLWDYLGANYVGPGVSSQTGNLRRLTANAESRIAGQNFVYRYRGVVDHYIDQIEPTEGGLSLFTDQSNAHRGSMVVGDGGYRIILQTFPFGGLVDWGGRKLELLRLYFQFLRFTLTSVGEEDPPESPETFTLLEVWPNPFNGTLTVSRASDQSPLRLNVFDPLGRKVGELNFGVGSQQTLWHVGSGPVGVYYLWPDAPHTRPVKAVYLK